MANVSCWYGDSGDGKSSMMAAFVDWLYRQDPTKKARLVTCDNIDVYEPYIDAGIVDVWNISKWPYPFEVVDYATRGFWPEDPEDPTSKVKPPTPEVWNTVRLMILEGASGVADAYMQRLGDIGGEGISIGPGTRANTNMTRKTVDEKSDLINFIDGEYGVGGNSQSHYNIVQKAIRKNFFNLSALPITAMVTALTTKAIEDGKPIYGPLIVGNKATPKVQQWCSSLIHLYCKSAVGQPNKYELHFKDHVLQETGTPVWKSIQRVPLRILDPKFKSVIEGKWDSIIPAKWEWTNDSQIADRYMELKGKMREAVRDMITSMHH